MSSIRDAYLVEHLHYTMYKAAEQSIAHAKQNKDRRKLYLVNAYVMMAFALEAYVNDFCAIAVPTPIWQVLSKKASTREKLEVVSSLLLFSIDFGRTPFQEFKTIFSIRNSLAHATRRVEVVTPKEQSAINFAVTGEEVGRALRDVSLATKLLEAVFQMASYLHENRAKKDSEAHPFVAGATSYFATISLTPIEQSTE